MVLPATKRDEILDKTDIECPGYKNNNTAWWDGSQIYGSSEAVTTSLRTADRDGKLLLTERGRDMLLPRDSAGNPKTGFNDNWWLGIEIMHTLFTMEHNAICNNLRDTYPDLTG
jgi:hypothetical protein